MPPWSVREWEAVPYGDEDMVPVVRVRTVEDDTADLKATNR